MQIQKFTKEQQVELYVYLDDGASNDAIETHIHGNLSDYKDAHEYEAKIGQLMLVPATKDSGHHFVLVAAAPKDMNLEQVKNLGAVIAKQAQRLKVASAAILNCAAVDEKLLILGMHLGTYVFNTYKSKEVKKNDTNFYLDTDIDIEALSEKGAQLASGVSAARDLVNTPAGDMKPQQLADFANELAASSDKISVKVLERKDCQELGMNSYLSVSEGSDAPPKFIHLTYTPDNPKKRVAFIGKGVTFDSGGLSLKPSNGMETMKSDMGGGAAVLGAFRAISELDVDVEVHGIIAATENMVNGRATRPGDIVTASNGKTIEILNTDAEGRLTLADALVYAEKLKPDYMVDLATLTGACVVALGEEIAAGYTKNDEISSLLSEAKDAVAEPIWWMPLDDRYNRLMESKIADVRNISTSRYGGSITAALFLQNFVEDTPWAHLDIAGPAFADRPINSYQEYGGTGFAVQTLVSFLMLLTE
jgi:leucyl aminopeptidase